MNRDFRPDIHKIVMVCDIPHDVLKYSDAERVCIALGESKTGIVFIHEFRPVENLHESKADKFEVKIKPFDDLETTWETVGIVHSHPIDGGPVPSPEDFDGLPEWLVGGVYWASEIYWFTA